MNRDRIVNRIVDLARAQAFDQCWALGRSNGIDAIDMPDIRHDIGRSNAAFREQARIRRGMSAPVLGPSLQVAQLDAQDGALDPLHPIVVSFQRVMILALRPPIAKQTDSAGQLRIVGSYDSTLSTGSEILSRIKAKGRQVAERACPPSFIFGSVGLSGVFD